MPDNTIALVARQPILDVQLRVVAYELLFRTPENAPPSATTNASRATSSVLIGALVDLGLERIAGALPVHVNFDTALLAHVSSALVDPGRLVVEVLDGAEADAPTKARLGQLRAEGFRIALDGYVPGTSDARLLDCVELVKLDLSTLSLEQVVSIAGELRSRGLVCVAKKVETQAQFEACAAGGIELFQGYFLQRPETFHGQRVEVSATAALRLLSTLHQVPWDPRDIERRIAADVGLAYRLLRSVRSARLYLPRRIENLTQAIVVLGRDFIIRLVSLIALGRCKDRPAELISNALLRARLAELLAERAKQPNTGSFYLAGVLSLLPAILGCEPAEAIAQLQVSQDIEDGVTRGAGSIGAALHCIHALERGQWDGVGFLALSREDIRDAYVEACNWLQQFAFALTED